jgi:NitT/TauT family transport system substrate-binding protein
MRLILTRVVVFAAIAAMLVACLPGVTAPEPQRLRVGLLPILDTLPFYIAEQQGYYSAEGVVVELVPVKGAQERDALMQAGEIDGMLADLVAVGLFNREQVQVQVVAVARRASADSAMLRVLSAPGSSLLSPRDLAGVPVAISKNSVIDYVTHRLLMAEGLSLDQIEVLEVSAIPVRFEQLMAGQIQAATLPDPMASGAMAGGAHLVVDDTRHPQYSQSVLAFSKAALESKSDAIARLLRAWDRAVADVNTKPGDFADLLIERGRVPESIRGAFPMPRFPDPAPPAESEWNDVVAWMVSEGLLDNELPYAGSVLTGLTR